MQHFTECQLKGCHKKHKGLGFCEMHLIRLKAHGSPFLMLRRKNGEGGRDRKGYIIIRKDGKLIPEHRWIMEQHLGRKLKWPGEVVHHINFDRTDNRLENLELLSNIEHDALHNHKHFR